MSIATLIIGESGTGKSYALNQLDPSDALLIQCLKQPLPFKGAKSKGWKEYSKETKDGNTFVTDDYALIQALMRKTKRKIIIIDDFQYLMSNEFMRRATEKGYDKFTEIANHAWSVLDCASNLGEDVRVYVMCHSSTDDYGHTKTKTIGKMLDEKITVEGMFTIVLKTVASGGDFAFSTVNSGNDTVKSPHEMFDTNEIPNDISFVDEKICEYYEIGVSEND